MNGESVLSRLEIGKSLLITFLLLKDEFNDEGEWTIFYGFWYVLVELRKV